MISKWQQFLTEQGAEWGDYCVDYFKPRDVLTEIANLKAHDQGIASLNELGVLKITGTEAEHFLQGQLSCDVAALHTQTTALPAAWCDRKGRMLLNLHLWKQADGYYALLPRSMFDVFKSQWQKYAIFSKVTYSETDGLVLGLYGQAATQCLQQHALLPEMNHSVIIQDGISCITLPSPKPYYYLVMNADKAIKQWPLFTQSLTPLGYNAWQWLMVKARWVYITPQTSSGLLPQMTELEKYHGVSFSKGCYVGQEIIARTQNLGKLKRHLQAIHLSSSVTVQPGDQLKNKSDQGIGVVVTAAQDTLEQYTLLVVLQDGYRLNELHLSAVDKINQ